MLDHLSAATNGLYPGKFSPLNFAVLGYRVSVTIKKHPKGHGGHHKPHLQYHEDDLYDVTIVITHKKKTWKQTRTISKMSLKTLEKVIVVYKKMETIKNSISFNVNLISNKIKETIFRVKKL